MARYDLRPAVPEDADEFALRSGDRAEIEAVGADPIETLRHSISQSLFAWTWRVGGRPMCALGCGAENILDGKGWPWLLSSEGLEHQGLPFLRHHRVFINQMLAVFPRLESYVDARYTISVKWLRWMGFEVHEAEPYGPLGAPFHRFTMGV